MTWIDEIKQALAENPGKSVGDVIPIARERWNKKKAQGLTDAKPESRKTKSSKRASPTSVVDEPGSAAPGSVEPGSVEPGSVEPGSATPGSANKKSKRKSKKAKKAKRSSTKKSKRSSKKSARKGKRSSKKSKRGGGCGCEAPLFQ
jgi:hypothetical protein